MRSSRELPVSSFISELRGRCVARMHGRRPARPHARALADGDPCLLSFAQLRRGPQYLPGGTPPEPPRAGKPWSAGSACPPRSAVSARGDDPRTPWCRPRRQELAGRAFGASWVPCQGLTGSREPRGVSGAAESAPDQEFVRRGNGSGGHSEPRRIRTATGSCSRADCARRSRSAPFLGQWGTALSFVTSRVPAAYCSRRVVFLNLPTEVLGTSSMKHQRSGSCQRGIRSPR